MVSISLWHARTLLGSSWLMVAVPCSLLLPVPAQAHGLVSSGRGRQRRKVLQG